MTVPASPLQRAAPRRGQAQVERARLEIVAQRARRRRRRRLAPMISVALVSGSLLSVVVGHALVAQEQVKLQTVETALTAAEVAHRHDVVSVATLQAPSRIVFEAESRLHMVTPGQIVQVPYVPLTTTLPPPKVSAVAPGTAGSSAHPGP